MKKRSLFSFAFCAIFVFLSKGALCTEASSTGTIQQVRPMMRQNLETLLELQEYASSSKRFHDPKNYNEIMKRIDRLASIAHTLPQVTDTERPGLSAVAVIFSEYLNDLKSGFKEGNPAYLRNRIRTAGGFCFECHTSSASEKDFIDTEKRVEKLKLTPFEKAEFLAATRQFDKALNVYKRLLSEKPENAERSTELMRASKNALTLAVRVKQDPQLAEELLSRVEKRHDLSQYFQEQIQDWKRDITGWKKEKTPTWSNAQPWLEKARQFSDRAHRLQKYPADRSGDISYLRAASFAQEALAHHPNEIQKAESFAILGDAYGTLQDPLLWNLNSYYYEACIQAAPQTSKANECFDRWVQETVLSYTGSLGTEIPSEVSEKMKRLQKLVH